MKHFVFLMFAVVCALSASGQAKQEVIASAGGYNTAPGISISWTLGETLIPTLTAQNGSITLTHGFQQQLLVTAIEENIDVKVSVKVYPNPANEHIYILFESPVETEIAVTLLDSHGRLVKTDIIEESILEKEMNLQDLPPGLYYLRLIKGKMINVYKVVKL